MGVQRIDRTGIVLDDLDAGIAFFEAVGLELVGRQEVEGEWASSVIAVPGMRAEIAMLAAPDGSQVELSRYLAPDATGSAEGLPATERGIRHLALVVDDLDETLAAVGALHGEVRQHEDVWRLCYVRGPGGILVELAQRLG
ncbi:VOC family protein [Agrococcus sp. SL85]|uniref:VOC family protein n=1 Tax=Agrococcus sp. SL85 TaxID=2995141 RepID=UPI00226CF361|nr:VOC family protein [Agrococcus sp. SL85]WAC66020.1 VOC family protein [Agrococcus sp. SL85]